MKLGNLQQMQTITRSDLNADVNRQRFPSLTSPAEIGFNETARLAHTRSLLLGGSKSGPCRPSFPRFG